MEAKTTEWRPGPTVCRCCLTEGCYKDISTEYFWMGKREVYSEMLSETLDLNIAYSQSGGPNSNSRLICEPCISRLRDATDFKRQVLECERSFMQYLDPVGSGDIGVSLELDKDVKIERVKDEKTLLDDDDDEFVPPEFGDDDDDDLDDQPLTKLASKIPKKESVDVLDLLDNAKITEKRKSSSKSKSSPAKKKLKKEVASSSKVKPEPRKKKEVEYVIIARNNAKVVLKHSTMYPFRIPTVSMVCVFCCESYDDPREYRNHIDDEHSSFSVETAFAHSVNNYTEFLKVDCVDLSCRICFQPFSTIDSIAKHLYHDHKMDIDPNVEVGMQMFKLGSELWVCALCDMKLPTLRKLSRHTSSHYHKYTCETCGKSYINKENLHKHIDYVHSDNKICKCKKMFSNAVARRAHFISSEKCWPYSCNVCLLRFMTHKAKNDHLIDYHGHVMKSYTCSECEKVFDKWHSYQTHFIMSHTDNSFSCSFCTNQFPTKTALAVHIVSHTKSQDFPCTLCPKKFCRRKNLMQHLLIHNEKRFECTSCYKKFSQKVGLKLHMRNHHREFDEIGFTGQ